MTEEQKPHIGDRQYRLNDGETSFMVDCYGGDTLQIETSKGVVFFSWSSQFGPLPEKKNGSVRDISYLHPFWREVSWWSLQGKQLENDNHAIWRKPQPEICRFVGRQVFVEQEGEPGWDWE